MTPTSSPLSDPRAKRWGSFIKYAGLLIIGFVVSPYIFTAITGLVGLAVAGALIGGYWMLMPAVETWAGNMRLKFVKAEAARNPVETLQSELNRQRVALDERKVAIGRLNGQITTFEDKLGTIGDKYGRQDSAYTKLAALDTIRTTFNETLASLDTDLMQSDAERMVNVTPAQHALPAPDARNAIDIGEVAVPVAAPRRKAHL